jgi:hypothetical protein
MSRLFITPREISFISDITKEVIKDVIGQRIILYPICDIKTRTDSVYFESPEKYFDNPIEVDALVDSPKVETVVTEFGPDQKYEIEAWIQYRDLVDKGIEIALGDFFSYGDEFYEITSKSITRNIYGHAEDKDGIHLTGTKARESLFKSKFFGPTDRKYSDEGAVQTTFVQQRGFASNSNGETNDTRDMISSGLVEPVITKPAEVAPTEYGSSFYGDDDK